MWEAVFYERDTPVGVASGFGAHRRSGERREVWHRGCFGIDRKVDIRLPKKGNLNSHGARPVHQIISMMKWIQTSRLSIKNSLYVLGFYVEIELN